MKLNIEYNEKKYTLAFTRATASGMANAHKDLDTEDIVEITKAELRAALKAEHADLSAKEAGEVVDYIVNNCQLVDVPNEDGSIEKGIIFYLNEMIGECLPKGFTRKTAKGFVVVD